MSALGAIEAPIAAADPRRTARLDVSDPERSLRVVDGRMPASAVPAACRPRLSAQPRSSSIPRTASQESPSSGPQQTGPILAGRILTGTIVSDRRRRFEPAGGVQVADAPLRLTRRGRIVVTVLLVAVFSVAVLLVTTLVSGRAQATNHGQPKAGYQGMHQIVVRPGQTLWSIAATAEPTADPRDVVQEIMAANALGSPGIAAGQLLWVP